MLELISENREAPGPARQIHCTAHRLRLAPRFINDIINARQVTCADSPTRETQIKSKFLDAQDSRLPQCLKSLGNGWLTCFESEEVVWRCDVYQVVLQPTEGQEELAQILPL